VTALLDAFLDNSSAQVGAVIFAGFLIFSVSFYLNLQRRAQPAEVEAPATFDPKTEATRLVEALIIVLQRQRDAGDAGSNLSRAEARLACERAVTLEEQNRQLTRAVTDLLRIRDDWPDVATIDRALTALRSAETESAETIFRSLADGLEPPGWRKSVPPGAAARHCGALLMIRAPEQAEQAYQTSLALEPVNPDAWNQLGLLSLRKGLLQEARDAFRKVLTLGDPQRDQGVLSAAVGNLGLVARGEGDLDRAEEQFRIATVLYAALDDRLGTARQYANLGQILQVAQRYDAAEACFTKSLELERSLGRLDLVAGCHSHLAMIAEARGNREAARRHWRQAEGLYERMGMEQMVRTVRNVMATRPNAPGSPGSSQRPASDPPET